MNKSLVFVGLFSVLALGSAVACSSTTTTTGSGGDDAGATKEGGSSGSSGSSGKDSSTAEDTGTSTDPDKACGTETTLLKCGTCCATNHPSGYKTFTDSLLACACNGTGADSGAPPCAADCADTICKTPPANGSTACSACLQTSVGQGGACGETVSATCMASADCLAEQKCIAQCQGKP